MISYNWMVTLANTYDKALISIYNYPIREVEKMNLKEKERELKNLGYDFKKNSPLKIN